MNMLNSNAAQMDPAAPSQATGTKKPEEVTSPDLVIAKDNEQKEQPSESVSMPARQIYRQAWA